MRIDSEVLTAFLHMQELDVQIIRAEKQLQELPERKAIADAMAKKRAVAAKAEQVEKLAAKAEDKLARITEEDDGLAGKARRIQDEIDQAQGDFRTVDARTKELTGVQERRDCSVAASSTCRHFLSVRPAFHLAMERSACHGITSSTPICVAVSMACSSCPVFASAWIKASLVVGCGSLPKLDTSAIPCCASRNTAWIRSPLPSESCNSSPSFRRMA